MCKTLSPAGVVDCSPTLAVVLVVAVLETSDEVTTLVVVVVVAVHCICLSVNMHNNYYNSQKINTVHIMHNVLLLNNKFIWHQAFQHMYFK